MKRQKKLFPTLASPLKMRKVKKVTFDSLEMTTIPRFAHQIERTKDQLKSSWYSREDLMELCAEAKSIVNMIVSVNGDMDAIDHSRVCVVGLEKFQGEKERERYRKLLIRSVLIRQEMIRGLGLGQDANCLRDISQMISASFKEFALWQAAMHKFHAYGSESELGVSMKEPRNIPDHAQNKRQKVSPESFAVSAGSSQNTDEVRAEVKQLMEGFCSR